MSITREFVSRVRNEFKVLRESCPHGIEVSFPSDSMQLLEATLSGPEQSLYKGGNFRLQIYLPVDTFILHGLRAEDTPVLLLLDSLSSEDYPLSPPTIRFLTPIYHVNVSQTTGEVCLGFLQTDNWSPTRKIQEILSAVFSLLIRPELENAYDHEVLNQYHHFKSTYDRKAKESAAKAK